MKPQELLELIGKIANLLEEAIENGDWKEVQTVMNMLDELYSDLEG